MTRICALGAVSRHVGGRAGGPSEIDICIAGGGECIWNIKDVESGEIIKGIGGQS